MEKEKINKDQKGVVIVGGSAAGIVAAITARKFYKDKKITLIRKEETVLIPCGIPYIFGTLKSVKENLISDAIIQKNDIELIIEEVKEVNPSEKEVITSENKNIPYEKLVLATGSNPIIPPIPGIDLPNVFAIRKDADLMEKLSFELEKSKKVAIIGGGFIGVEFADECNKRGGGEVTIVELLPHCLSLALDDEFCEEAEDKLSGRGIKVLTGKKVTAIEGNGKAEYLKLDNGEKIKVDLVILGIGSSPNTEIARKIGLKIGETKAIWVDKYMRTSDENIFACGDCAEKTSFFTQKPSALRLASIASFEARIAGANLYEIKRENIGVVGVFATALGAWGVGAAGLIEKGAKNGGYEVVIGRASAPDKHPGSIPGSMEMKMKLIFSRDSNIILGGEVSGGSTAGEVANIIATMIQNKMKAEEIATFQMGTHPVLTASPIAYQLANAAEYALAGMR